MKIDCFTKKEATMNFKGNSDGEEEESWGWTWKIGSLWFFGVMALLLMLYQSKGVKVEM